MISIDKTKVSKPHSILNDTKIGKQLNKIIFELKPIGSTYRSEKVKKALAELYEYYDDESGIKGIKCAFCESHIAIQSTNGEVERYRPKGGIKIVQFDRNGKMLRRENANIDFIQLKHKGYYWLYYEWTNLLLSCGICNNHKTDYFPIKDEKERISDKVEFEEFVDNDGKFNWEHFRATSKKLQQEQRLLLNPELDKVEEYFTFLPNGKIESVKLEGIVSIDIYDLNREGLQTARLGIIKKLQHLLENALEDFNGDDNALEKFFNRNIKDLDNPKRAYSRFGYYVKNNFDSFVIERFKKDKKPFIAEFLKIEYEDWKSNQAI
jgi:hypothetical protein